MVEERDNDDDSEDLAPELASESLTGAFWRESSGRFVCRYRSAAGAWLNGGTFHCPSSPGIVAMQLAHKGLAGLTKVTIDWYADGDKKKSRSWRNVLDIPAMASPADGDDEDEDDADAEGWRSGRAVGRLEQHIAHQARELERVGQRFDALTEALREQRNQPQGSSATEYLAALTPLIAAVLPIGQQLITRMLAPPPDPITQARALMDLLRDAQELGGSGGNPVEQIAGLLGTVFGAQQPTPDTEWMPHVAPPVSEPVAPDTEN